MADGATTDEASARDTGTEPTVAIGALLAAWIPFVVGGLLVIQTDTPPSESPLLGMLSHALWALAIAILAVGVVGLLRRFEPLRRGLAGYLAAGTLGLGVLHGLQWVTWAYVDVRGAREATADRDLVLETIVVPYGAGHLLTYAVLLGTAVALLGWALRRTSLTSRSVGWAGVVLGALTVAGATVSLIAAFGGGSEGHVLFDATTLLLPVCYLWALVLGGLSHREYRSR